MRQTFAILILVSLAAMSAWAQQSAGTGTAPATRPSTTAKPSGGTTKTQAAHAVSANPTEPCGGGVHARLHRQGHFDGV